MLNKNPIGKGCKKCTRKELYEVKCYSWHLFNIVHEIIQHLPERHNTANKFEKGFLLIDKTDSIKQMRLIPSADQINTIKTHEYQINMIKTQMHQQLKQTLPSA